MKTSLDRPLVASTESIYHTSLVNVYRVHLQHLSGQCLQSLSTTPLWSMSTESIYHTSLVNVYRVDLQHLSGQCLQSLSTTPLWSMLQDLNVVFSLRRGQGRTWTLAKDLLNDLNAIDCNINDVINFSSSQFTRLVDSFNSNLLLLKNV